MARDTNRFAFLRVALYYGRAVGHAVRQRTANGTETRGRAGMRVYGILTLVMALLQRERRVSYWALKQEFGLDDVHRGFEAGTHRRQTRGH